MKRNLFAGLIITFLLILSSCSLDNYFEPKEIIKGRLVDAITGESFIGGGYIELIETSWIPAQGQTVTPQNLSLWPYGYNTESTKIGTFTNTRIFDATYTITPIGAFYPFVPIIDKKVSGVTDLGDLKITPYLRIKNFSAKPVGELKIEIRYTLERGDATEVPVKVYRSSCGVSINPFMGVNSAVAPYSKEWKDIPDEQIIGVEQIVVMSVRTVGTYYVNCSAVAKNATYNVAEYMNSSQVIMVDIR